MRPAEPRYPVTFGDADTAQVCIDCALQLSRDGINAWCWPVTRPPQTLGPGHDRTER
jgi:hypothetical protein